MSGALFEEYGLPASAPAPELDALVRVAAALCGTDGAAVHLLDGRLQHPVAVEGTARDATPQEESGCAVALARPELRYGEDAHGRPDARPGGIAATRALRATLPGHLPVYALTADASGRERQACLAAGMDGFLTTPVSAATLAEVLDEVLSQHHAG